MKYWHFIASSVLVVCLVKSFLTSASTIGNENVSTRNNPLVRVDIRDLVALVDANETFSRFATDVYKRKHSIKHVLMFDPKNESNASIFESDGFIWVEHYGTALRFLKFFGHFIQKMNIHYTINYIAETDPKELNSYINLYCSDTIQSLTIEGTTQSLLDQITKPFKAVESLTISTRIENIASFNRIFPAVRYLRLTPVYMEDKSSIEQWFPHLEHLYIQLDQESLSLSDYGTLLLRNPQIKKLSIWKCSPEFLYTVNEIVPNITNLSLVDYNPYNESSYRNTVFKHVTFFSLLNSDGHVPKNIFFEELTQLQLHSTSTEDWILFAERNPRLEKLDLARVDDEQFKRIITVQKNLVEAKLRFAEDVSDEHVLEFIRNNRNASQIQFTRQSIGFGKVAAHLNKKGFGNTFNITVHDNLLELNRRA
ncbi:uncharacterized protein LOC129572012 [Sitodiplosis mosellana]|uniref:uncharacterized protein LOC129572012 n=1 Tax=Sitodiplosis mosellana TaxID=263140 RepID=UPI002444682F|nr:uncharacterized protein LOC129572012 [Sitodiplosis mosellana]